MGLLSTIVMEGTSIFLADSGLRARSCGGQGFMMMGRVTF